MGATGRFSRDAASGKHDVIAPLGVEGDVLREPPEKPFRPRAGGDHHPVRRDAPS